MSLSKLIQEVNEPLIECLPDGVVYGLAQSMVRKVGTELETLPAVVNHDGEGKYVGVDDDFGVIVYHKSLSIVCREVKGHGDFNDIVNTYTNCMIVYLDRKRLSIRADQLLLLIQAVFPSTIKLPPYKTVAIKFASVIMDDIAVFASEYKGTSFSLPAEKNIFQINYGIEATFSKNCFKDCSNILNF